MRGFASRPHLHFWVLGSLETGKSRKRPETRSPGAPLSLKVSNRRCRWLSSNDTELDTEAPPRSSIKSGQGGQAKPEPTQSDRGSGEPVPGKPVREGQRTRRVVEGDRQRKPKGAGEQGGAVMQAGSSTVAAASGCRTPTPRGPCRRPRLSRTHRVSQALSPGRLADAAGGSTALLLCAGRQTSLRMTRNSRFRGPRRGTPGSGVEEGQDGRLHLCW